MPHTSTRAKPCWDWWTASANTLTVLALSVGWRDHWQSKMRSRIRDHRHCGIVIARCYCGGPHKASEMY